MKEIFKKKKILGKIIMDIFIVFIIVLKTNIILVKPDIYHSFTDTKRGYKLCPGAGERRGNRGLPAVAAADCTGARRDYPWPTNLAGADELWRIYLAVPAAHSYRRGIWSAGYDAR